MTTYVVLIRGINVGATRRVKMAELRAALAAAGFEDVRTHLASGNVVLRSGDSQADVREAVEAVLARELHVDARVMVRTAAQLAKVVAENPFAGVEDGKKLHVAFLAGRPELPADRERFAPENFELRDELYISLPDGMRDSPLMKALSERKLGVPATVRNWNTVTAVHELSRDQGPRPCQPR